MALVAFRPPRPAPDPAGCIVASGCGRRLSLFCRVTALPTSATASSLLLAIPRPRRFTTSATAKKVPHAAVSCYTVRPLAAPQIFVTTLHVSARHSPLHRRLADGLSLAVVARASSLLLSVVAFAAQRLRGRVLRHFSVREVSAVAACVHMLGSFSDPMPMQELADRAAPASSWWPPARTEKVRVSARHRCCVNVVRCAACELCDCFVAVQCA